MIEYVTEKNEFKPKIVLTREIEELEIFKGRIVLALTDGICEVYPIGEYQSLYSQAQATVPIMRDALIDAVASRAQGEIDYNHLTDIRISVVFGADGNDQFAAVGQFQTDENQNDLLLIGLMTMEEHRQFSRPGEGGGSPHGAPLSPG